MATTVLMSAGVHDGSHFETVKYPTDEIALRVISAGNVQVTEYTSEDRDGPPPHRHEWDEVEYVIEGTVEFWLDGQWTRGGPGTVQMLPAGVAHSVRIPEGRARILMVTIGRHYDGFARDMAHLLSGESTDGASVADVAARHGVRLGT